METKLLDQLVSAKDDPWIPIERGKALFKLIGQNRFEAMSGVGHLPQLEAPETVLKAFSEFL
jgi:pimeloyl-ACP methyl ester carboxylesterase